MATFVDTSAFYAHLDAADRFHDRARRIWGDLLGSERLVTHNYVLLETAALLQSRLGTEAVRDFHDIFEPELSVHWVDRELHDAALQAVVSSARRTVSLVDQASFLVMRKLAIGRAFAIDEHFAAAGFDVIS